MTVMTSFFRTRSLKFKIERQSKSVIHIIQARTQGGCPGCPGNHLFVLKYLIQIKLALFDISFKKGLVKGWLPNEIDQKGNT